MRIDLTNYYYEDRIERIKKEIEEDRRGSFKRRLDWDDYQVSPYVPTPIPPYLIVRKKKRKLLAILKYLIP